MTDFFTSLVDRALDRTPVLERRQPTLFEPVSESAAAFGEQSVVSPLRENEVVVESTHSPFPQTRVENNVSRISQVPLPRDEIRLQSVETQPAPAPGPRLDQNRQSERDNATLEAVSRASIKEPAKLASVSEAGAEAKPPSITQEITIAPLRTIETIVERRIEREVVKEHSTEKPAINEVQTFARETPQLKTRPALDRDAEQKHSSKAKAKSLRPLQEQTKVRPAPEKKPAVRQDRLPIVRAIPRVESRLARKHQAPPSVHVTIGRVEVRATPAPTGRTRVAQSVGPKTTLEDYLRSRGEGNK
jgi:hypothetical protein